jgi:hypothetical protein
MAVSVPQLEAWLTEALAAKQKLMIGGGVRRVQGPSGEVEFTEANMDRLDAWITKLQGWIANGGMPAAAGISSNRPIRFSF